LSFDAYIPGATAVGITYKDGVILGAERRITLSNYVLSKSGRKVFKVTDNTGAACAGMVADMQNLVRQVAVYTKLKELEVKRTLRPGAVAKLTSIIMFEQRFAPFITQVILGGLDSKPRIWILDPLGSLLPDDYGAIGTGSEMAVGVLEDGYAPSMSAKDARELLLSSMKAAIARDSMSGNGIDILTIDKSGIEEDRVELEH
jgi:proteasome beta subunit